MSNSERFCVTFRESAGKVGQPSKSSRRERRKYSCYQHRQVSEIVTR